MRSCGRNSKKVSGWDWKDYLKDTYWFASECNLPNSPQGLVPEAISEKLVSRRMLKECFEEKADSQGYKWKRSKMIPVTEIRELIRLVHGEAYVKTNRISTPLAKGIYADRILGLSVNWALYAHTKYRDQLIRGWKNGLPSPHVNPSLLRIPIRYNPPPPLNLKGNHTSNLRIPTGSEFRSDDTRYSSSTKPAACKLGMKLRDSCDSLDCETDPAVDTDQFFDETNPVEREATSPHNPFPNDHDMHMTGLDKMHALKNVKVKDSPKNSEDFRTGALVKQPVLSLLTPERLRLEILSLKQQRTKLRDDISALTTILEVVSMEGRLQGPSM